MKNSEKVKRIPRGGEVWITANGYYVTLMNSCLKSQVFCKEYFTTPDGFSGNAYWMKANLAASTEFETEDACAVGKMVGDLVCRWDEVLPHAGETWITENGFTLLLELDDEGDLHVKLKHEEEEKERGLQDFVWYNNDGNLRHHTSKTGIHYGRLSRRVEQVKESNLDLWWAEL